MVLAFDAPFKWTKQVSLAFRRHPSRACASPGPATSRTRRHPPTVSHMIDIVPTILEATGIKGRTWLMASSKSPSKV